MLEVNKNAYIELVIYYSEVSWIWWFISMWNINAAN